MEGKDRDGEGRGRKGREERKGKEGKGKVASWLLGDGRPCLVINILSYGSYLKAEHLKNRKIIT